MIIIAGTCLLDWERMRVFYNGRVLSLPIKRLRLLDILLRNSDWILSRNEIKRELWGPDAKVSNATVDKEIERLRACFAGSSVGSPIQTIRGVGYMFSTADTLPRLTPNDSAAHS
jgi:two-component system phosphate regulon response regulator PhoB